MTHLEVLDLSYAYGLKEEIFRVKLPAMCLERGQSAVLTGVSGSGKSTLLECLSLIRTGFSAAAFQLNGKSLKDLKGAALDRMRGGYLGYMPQKGGLIPFLKLEDDLRLSLALAKKLRRFEKSGPSFEESLELCARLNIEDKMKCYAHEMSEGQRQRASFVKAVCRHPELLLMDEPTSALDPGHARELFSLRIEESLRLRICTVAVTHDLNLASDFNLRHFSYDEELSSAHESVFTERT